LALAKTMVLALYCVQLGMALAAVCDAGKAAYLSDVLDVILSARHTQTHTRQEWKLQRSQELGKQAHMSSRLMTFTATCCPVLLSSLRNDAMGSW
jgi:hypothetical protein